MNSLIKGSSIIIKILLILILILSVSYVVQFAEDTTPESTSANPDDILSVTSTPTNENLTSEPRQDIEPYSSAPSSSSASFDLFAPENILTIIVITVGVVLILLGIAIIIRIR